MYGDAVHAASGNNVHAASVLVSIVRTQHLLHGRRTGGQGESRAQKVRAACWLYDGVHVPAQLGSEPIAFLQQPEPST